MRIVTNRTEISEYQEKFSRLVTSRATSKIPVSIGYQSGQFDTEVSWLSDLGYWAYFGFPPSEKSPGERYWNVFGLGKPSGTVSIVCEINPPVYGINRQAAGAFVRDDSASYLIHRGILNARGRIDKDFIFREFRGQFVSIDDFGQITKVILIGSLNVNDFPEKLSDFILEANRIKEIVRAKRSL
jgi:hypothetical protein